MTVCQRNKFCLDFLVMLLLMHQSVVAWGNDSNVTGMGVCDSSDSICSIWRSFRERHPAPYQTFAVQELSEEAVIIISEAPPPFISSDVIELARVIFGKDLLEASTLRWPMGYDGWLEDVVLRVRHDGREGTIPAVVGHSIRTEMFSHSLVDRVRLMSRVLHGTSDGFYLDRVSSLVEEWPYSHPADQSSG